MKGLLYKDFQIAIGQNRFLLLLFLGLSALGLLLGSLFPAIYGFLILTLAFPGSLFGSDHLSGWDRYAVGLPLTPRQLVSSKFLVCLPVSLLMFVLSLLVFAREHGFVPTDLFYCAALSFAGPAVSLAIFSCLPHRRAQFVYPFVVGLFAAACIILGFDPTPDITVGLGLGVSVVLMLIVFALYPLAWAISVWGYSRRERIEP